MIDLRDRFDQEVAKAQFARGGYEGTLARVRRRERNRRVIAGSLALVLAMGGVSVAWIALRPRHEQPPSVSGQLRLAAHIQVGVGEGSVWFLSCDRCSDDEVTTGRARGRLLRVDPASRRVVDSIAIQDASGPMAIGYGAVWIANFGRDTVTRVDTATNRIAATIPLSLPWEAVPSDSAFLPSNIAVGEGAVWVDTARGAVARIDPGTNGVLYAPVVSRGGDILGGLAAGEGAVWVDEGVEGVRRLDPRNGALTARVPPYQDGRDLLSPQFFAPGGGFVWATGDWARWSDEQGDLVGTNEWVLLRIDPRTDGMVPVADLRGSGWPVAFGGGTVWVVSGSTRSVVFRFDPGRGRITATVDLPAGATLVPADDGGAPWLVGRDGSLTRISAPDDVLPVYEPASAFIPPTHREGGSIVMPVTFPDGTTAEILFPPSVDLAGMGLQPDVSYLWLDDPSPRFPLSFYRGDPDPALFLGDAAVGTFESRSGNQIELWSADEEASDSGEPYLLLYRMGAWTILVPVSDAESAEEVAHALDGHETDEGFVVIDAEAPIGLSDEPGDGGGPELAFGDIDPRPHHVRTDSPRLMILRPMPCTDERHSSRTGDYASMCLEESIFVSMYGEPAFLDASAKGLRARNVQLAS